MLRKIVKARGQGLHVLERQVFSATWSSTFCEVYGCCISLSRLGVLIVVSDGKRSLHSDSLHSCPHQSIADSTGYASRVSPDVAYARATDLGL